jgi:hypothetical protein
MANKDENNILDYNNLPLNGETAKTIRHQNTLLAIIYILSITTIIFFSIAIISLLVAYEEGMSSTVTGALVGQLVANKGALV